MSGAPRHGRGFVPRLASVALGAALLVSAAACDRDGQTAPPGAAPTSPPPAELPPPSEDEAAGATDETSTPAAGEPTASSGPADPVTEATSPTTDDGAPDPTSAPTSAPEPKPRAPLPKVIHAETNAACGKGAGVGQSLRDFDLPLIGADGKRLSKRSLRGKVSLVNLWGTWCEPCKKELPEFARLYRHYRGHGLSFVAIATDADPAPVEAFAKSRKLAGRFAYDGEPYSKTYGERSFPFTFVVDRRGTIVAAYDGYKEECIGQLEADLRAALDAAR